MIKLTINQKEVELAFRFSLLLALADKWNIKTVEGVINRLNFAGDAEIDQSGQPQENVTMPVQFFKDIADVVSTAAEVNGVDLGISQNELVDTLFADMDTMQNIITALLKAMPQPKQNVNPEARSSKK